MRNPGSVSLHNKWKELRSLAQKELRLIENKWWTEKAEEIQSYANNNDTQKFYNAIKAVFGPPQRSLHPVRSKDGSTLIKDRDGILARCAEHLSELLNCINPIDPTVVSQIPQFPVIPNLDAPPSFYEISTAISHLKNNKAAGPDGIPAETSSLVATTCNIDYIISSSQYGPPVRYRNSGKMPTLLRSSSAKETDLSAATAVAYLCCR